MARYVARVRTSKSPAEVFAYLADLRNFAAWDPGVVDSVQVEGDGPSSTAVYDVTVDNGGRRSTLRYRVTEYDPPHRLKVVGKTGLLTSVDLIDVGRQGGETVAVYDARLKLPLLLRVADPLLARVFRKIGDKAAAGLEKALEGTLVR